MGLKVKELKKTDIGRRVRVDLARFDKVMEGRLNGWCECFNLVWIEYPWSNIKYPAVPEGVEFINGY